ncbi:DUF6168 family protein [Galbibacter sp. EGI 63066]|uniref:DUF6168 family protein n=1 Tax=Galbibacter sp. EGI 63066 TaxID=2993559 RepID=UPI00224903C5|nr:DUF6168 family protein [Galbibacter sp. EGI 63066]MCX2681184.1 DUF6168 family protein [Galbibacter sp. EGI 63066]
MGLTGVNFVIEQIFDTAFRSMKKKIISFLGIVSPLVVILAVAQSYLQTSLFPDTMFYYSMWSIYTFHFLSTIIVYFSTLGVNKKMPDKTGFAFLALSLLKMLAAIVFLVPLIQSEMTDPIPSVFSFFIPYFIFLFIETFFVLKLLK